MVLTSAAAEAPLTERHQMRDFRLGNPLRVEGWKGLQPPPQLLLLGSQRMLGLVAGARQGQGPGTGAGHGRQTPGWSRRFPSCAQQAAFTLAHVSHLRSFHSLGRR